MKRMGFAAAGMAFGLMLTAVAEVTVVDEYAVAGDAEIRVETGDVKRIHYLSGTAAATISKTGGGTLEIAVVGDTNVAFNVTEGTLRSVRPGTIRSIAGLYYHVDASDTTGMTITEKGGTNFVSRWGDVDGRDAYAASKSGQTTKPFLVASALNGLSVMDFGGFVSNESISTNSETSAYMDWGTKKFVRDSFWVWKDHEGLKDLVSSSGNDFYGPTPVLLGSAVYRGKGGNGKEFPFANTGPREALKAEAYVDGAKLTSPTSARIGEGWHLANYRMSGATNSTDETNYGGESFGRRTYTPPTGGFRLAEAVFSTEYMSDADRAYVNDYLNCKWFAPQVASVRIAPEATLDVSAAPVRIGRLDVIGDGTVTGLDNLRALEVYNPSNTALSVSGTFNAVDYSLSATPNLTFAGDAAISVPAGTARGNIVAASGVLAKSGAGALELSYLEDGVTGVAVTEGSFTLSPILTADSAIHFDASQFVTTEEASGRAIVTGWDDVNPGRGSSVAAVTGGYKFNTSKSVSRPYLVADLANGLPMVDFGDLADATHTDGYGAALKLTKPLSGGKNTLATGDGFLQAFAVWQDDDSTIDLPLVEGNEFVGPCLFGSNWSWQRGKGGNGNGFPLAGTSSGDFKQSLKVDGTQIPVAQCASKRISKGVHLLDTRPGCQDGLSGVQVLGCKVEAAATSWYGGVKLGEFLFFRHYIPAGQRAKIAAALGVKWFGTDGYKLEHVFDSLRIADSASASFPYADVTVTNLTASGAISARSLTVASGGTLTVTGTENAVSCLTANDVSFSGRGTILLDAPCLGETIATPIKVIAAAGGPTAPRKVGGWKTSGGVKAVLVRRADGYYLDNASGMVLVFR